MTDSQRELHEVRELLQGALADKAVLEERLRREREARAQSERRLEEVTHHRDRLLGEKERFNNWTLGDAAH
jgi:hypothetical protein